MLSEEHRQTLTTALCQILTSCSKPGRMYGEGDLARVTRKPGSLENPFAGDSRGFNFTFQCLQSCKVWAYFFRVSVRRPCRGEGEAGGQVEMLPVEGFLQWICCRARPCWAFLMLMYADVSGRARGAARGQRVTHPSSTAEDDCGRRHGLSRDATRTLRLRRWNDLVGEGSGTRVGDVEADMTRKDMLSCGFCGAAQSH